MNIVMKRIAIAIALVSVVAAARADDDTLRDLGATAAPGEVPKYDGAQWRNAHDNLGVSKLIPGPGLTGGGTNEDVTVSVDFGTSDTNNAVARQSYVDATMPPVGSVVAWVKSFPNTPTNIPPKWVECSGQVLSDADSPYDGQTIPALNASKRFLRGNTTSGTEGGTTTHSHSVSIGGGSGNTGANARANAGTYGTSGSAHYPPFYEVVWIMRVK